MLEYSLHQEGYQEVTAGDRGSGLKLFAVRPLALGTTAVEGMALGAFDYLTRPCHREEPRRPCAAPGNRVPAGTAGQRHLCRPFPERQWSLSG